MSDSLLPRGPYVGKKDYFKWPRRKLIQLAKTGAAPPARYRNKRILGICRIFMSNRSCGVIRVALPVIKQRRHANIAARSTRMPCSVRGKAGESGSAAGWRKCVAYLILYGPAKTGVGAILRHWGKTAMTRAGAEQIRRAAPGVAGWIGGSNSATEDRLGPLVETAAALERRALLRVNR